MFRSVFILPDIQVSPRISFCIEFKSPVLSSLHYIIFISFQSFSYSGVCSDRVEVSIYYVIVAKKKLKRRWKVHIIWVGKILSSPSFNKFTLFSYKAFWVDPAPSQSLNTYHKIHISALKRDFLLFKNNDVTGINQTREQTPQYE